MENEKHDLETIVKAIKDRGLTGYELSKILPLTEVGINKILNGTSKNPRSSTLELLHNYLFKGEVTPFKTLTIQEPKEQIANKSGNVYEEIGDGKYKIFVKKVPVKAFGSYLSDYQDPDFFDELKQVSFTVDHIGRGRYICFEVQGNSMNGGGIYDAPEGAELLCRELGRQHWKDGFRDSVYGWVVVHKETVLYKDIKNVDMQTGEMILSSRSGLPQHPEFTVNLNDVRQIWKVIKRSF